MSKQTSKFAAAARRAKRLYKTGRYATFADAVRAAYRSGGKKKPKAARKVTRKTKPKRARKVVKRSRAGIPSARAKYVSLLNDRLKTYLFLKDRATLKRVKRHYAKTIAQIKRQLKNLT